MSKLFHLITVIITALLFAGCGDKYVSKEWNQKMTVTVEIDGETFTGSAIQRLQVNYNAELGPYPNRHLAGVRRKNEAVIIELGEHGYLFALWGRSGFTERYVKSYPTEYSKGPPKLSKTEEKSIGARSTAYKKYLEALARPGNQVSLERYPEFIMFEDISNPKTIRSFRAKGAGYAPTYHDTKGFKDVYGPTARVISVIIENTKDPTNLGQIEKTFESNFFSNWHLLAYGDDNTSGPCHEREYKKRNKLYCTTRKTTFIWDGAGVGAKK